MNMKAIKIFTLAIFSFASFNLPIYATQNDSAATTKEYGMLRWLSEVDKNEINAGKMALKKTSNADIKNYAEEMVNDHNKNLEDTKELMKHVNAPSKDSDAKVMADKGKREAKKLNALKANAFDKAYIDAMVDDHSEVLEMLDKDISTLDSSSKIASHLKDTREAVNSHLIKAKSIQENLSK